MNQLNMTSIAAGAGILTLYKSFTSLVSAVKGFSQQALQSYSHFEQIESGLQGVLKDVKKGTDMFEDLRKFSFDTTFGVDTLANAAQQLIGVGESASTLKTTLLQLGNVASGDTNKFNELVSIFAKIQNTGKAGSMQLQQLALRGVPIYQYLKQIGVQGTATGEDIRKAFAKMTEEGEVFYGTMERINDTIQGKEGFISDTWREFLTSFAEASGLADMYKAALDGVYDALQGVVDWLQAINANPVYQAIFRGVLIGLLTTLVAFIGGALIVALKNVIAHLVTIAALQAAINPIKMVAGFAIGAGAFVGLKALVDNLTGVKDAANEATEAIKKLSAVDIAQNKIDSATKKIEGNNSIIKNAEEKIKLLQKMTENAQNANSFRTAGEWATANGRFDLLLGAPQKMEEEWKKAINGISYKKQIDEQNEIIRLANARNEALQRTLDIQNGILNSQQKYTKAVEAAPTIAANMLTGSEKQLQEYKKTLKEIQDYASVTRIVESTRTTRTGKTVTSRTEEKLPADILAAFDTAGDKLKKKIEDTKIKIANENLSDWQKVLKGAMGFTDKEVYEGAVKGRGKDDFVAPAVANYSEKLSTKYDTMKAYSDAGLINIDNLTLAQNKLEEINKVITAMRDSGLWKSDEDTVSDMRALQNQAILETYNAQMDYYSKELDLLREQTGEYEKQRQIRALMNQGFDETRATELVDIQKQYNNELLKQTDVWGALKKETSDYLQSLGASKEVADLFANSLVNIVSTEIPNQLVSGFEEIGKALQEGASAGDEMKKIMLQMVQTILKNLAITCLQAGVMLIAQSGWAGVPPALALFALGGASGIASGAISSLSSGSSDTENEQQKQIELLQSLNEEYTKLRDAIKEQEEYYLTKKNQLNAEQYKLNATKVNDMILTDKGVFSTDPQDTLIAMKRPGDLLGSGSANVYVTINNYTDSEVSTEESLSEDGARELIVTISRQVARDFASGANGWDSAYNSQQSRISGRRVSI